VIENEREREREREIENGRERERERILGKLEKTVMCNGFTSTQAIPVCGGGGGDLAKILCPHMS